MGKSGSDREGIAYGRVIEFLKEAIKPINSKLREEYDSYGFSDSSDSVGWSLDEDAWRSRIRTAQRARAKKDAAISSWIDGMLFLYEEATG